MAVHIPRVRIMNGPPDADGWPASAVLARVEIDGQLWAVLAYELRLRTSISERTTLTLTIEADVTVERPERVAGRAQ